MWRHGGRDGGSGRSEVGDVDLLLRRDGGWTGSGFSALSRGSGDGGRRPALLIAGGRTRLIVAIVGAGLVGGRNARLGGGGGSGGRLRSGRTHRTAEHDGAPRGELTQGRRAREA